MPYFSITIPVYNVEKYLHQCLDSVVHQTFTDFEVIILDDGSTDQSGAICDEYKQKDSRIKVIHDKNEGLLMARRRALKHVTGKYVLFLDSDDYWETDLLENIYNILQEKPVDMIIFRYRAVDKNGRELYLQKQLLKDGEIIQDGGRFLARQLATSFEFNPMVLKIVKKEKIDIEGDYSDLKEVSMAEDALQSMKLSGNIDTFLYLATSYYNYRVNISSVSSRITSKYLADYLKVRQTMDEIMEKYYREDPLFYRDKSEYDIRGFVAVLADSAVSSLISKREWIAIREKIVESSLFGNVLVNRKEIKKLTQLYLFFIKKGSYNLWRLLGKVKGVLRFLYNKFM